ncbi:MAG TPA: 50S ribosomal protein L10 [Gaiella sp.]|jgi:large subunit ribosomal protein L10
MLREEKERLVAELTERLRETDSLIVADYRGLTNAELAGLRTALRAHGARLTVVKNTLTRRAAEAAGADLVLALLEGPTAIAFIESEGDPVAVAKALADTARETKVLSLRGGVLSGKPMEAADVEALAKLPAVDVLKSQLVGVIVAPLTQLVGLLSAPLRDLVGLIDARIAQLEERGEGAPPPEEPAAEEPAAAAPEAGEAAEADAPPEEPAAEEPASEAQPPAAEASPEEAPAAEGAADEPVAASAALPDDEPADTTQTDVNDDTQEEQE